MLNNTILLRGDSTGNYGRDSLLVRMSLAPSPKLPSFRNIPVDSGRLQAVIPVELRKKLRKRACPSLLWQVTCSQGYCLGCSNQLHISEHSALNLAPVCLYSNISLIRPPVRKNKLTGLESASDQAFRFNSVFQPPPELRP